MRPAKIRCGRILPNLDNGPADRPCAAELFEQGFTVAAANGPRQRSQIFVEAAEHFQHCLLVGKKNIAPHRRIGSRDASEVAEAARRELQHL